MKEGMKERKKERRKQGSKKKERERERKKDMIVLQNHLPELRVGTFCKDTLKCCSAQFWSQPPAWTSPTARRLRRA